MTPDDLKKLLESKAVPPLQVDWLWLDLGFLAPETPNGEQSAKLQAQLDAWAWEFVSSGGQIGWDAFRRLNEMSRAAFMRAGARVRRESAMEIAAALSAALAPVPAGANPISELPAVPPEPDSEPTVEEFTPIGSEPNAAGDPPQVGATLESALDYVESTLRGEG